MPRIYDRKLKKYFKSNLHRRNYYRKVFGSYCGPAYKRRRLNRDYSGDVIMGKGSYYMRKKTVGARKLDPPAMHSTKTGCVVRHREFIQDIPAAASFILAAFAINPGISNTFPWLSTVAQNFEEWEPKGIVFEYRTTSSDAVVSTNANAALGSVIYATEYNPYNGNFASKQQMENYEFAQSCKPSSNMMHAVECKKTQNPLGSYYIRTQSVPSTQDQRFYDLGVFQVGVTGMQSTGTIVGELWVTYEIELRKPRIQVGQAGLDPEVSSSVDHFTLGTTGMLPATPFGTTNTALTFPNLLSTLGGCVSPGIVPAASCAIAPTRNPAKNNFQGGVAVLDSNGLPTGALGATTANTYYFPPGVSNGVYMITYSALYGVAGTAASQVITATNCVAANLLGGNTVANFNNTTSANTTTDMTIFFVTVSRANAKFTMTGTPGMTTPTYADLWVMELPPQIN